MVQIVDPAEETFPYWGRIEFIEPEGGGRITAGRAETWRADYAARVKRHRDEIRAETDRLGWSFTIHRTDRPASELLLALHARIGAAAADAGPRWPVAAAESRAADMIGGLPLGFAEPLVLIGLLTLPVLWWLLRMIPPRPRRIDFPPTRLLLRDRTQGRNPGAYALVAHACCGLRLPPSSSSPPPARLWHPPLATTQSRAPIAILIDDGWAAASTWDARVRTADDIVARAADDRRAVALIPLSNGPHDISFEPADSARVRLHQIQAGAVHGRPRRGAARHIALPRRRA